jgi:hypothetical protein
MTIEEAREYWCRRLERADGYSDEHWDAEERHSYKDYVDAMKHAITALAIYREHEEVKHPKTNGDRIRQMTDEELAGFIGFNECKDTAHGYECHGWIQPHCDGECKKYFIAWLKQEVREDACD